MLMKLSTAVTSAIYQKTLSLSSTGRKKTTTGEIVNLVSNDTQRIWTLIVSCLSLPVYTVRL